MSESQEIHQRLQREAVATRREHDTTWVKTLIGTCIVGAATVGGLCWYQFDQRGEQPQEHIDYVELQSEYDTLQNYNPTSPSVSVNIASELDSIDAKVEGRMEQIQRQMSILASSEAYQQYTSMSDASIVAMSFSGSLVPLIIGGLAANQIRRRRDARYHADLESIREGNFVFAPSELATNLRLDYDESYIRHYFDAADLDYSQVRPAA